MNNQMNIMITNISLTRFSNIRKSQYELDDKEGSELQTDGFVTSEAPIKLLIKKLRKSQGKLDKIIFIESDKVREKIDIPAEKEKMLGDQEEFVDYMSDEKEVTLVSYLKKRINDTAERCGLANPEIIEVNITDEPDDKDLVQCIMDVQNELIKQSDNREINVYIDANGGIRYVMVMLTSIMNVLESQYNNIKLQSVYSTIFDDSKTKKVRDTKSTYISAQLVAAVNEFTNYGRISSLKNYFDMRHSMDNSKDTWRMWNDIDKCIEKLSEISEALQLCRSSVILELFYGKRDSSEFGINAILNKFKEEYKNSDFADAKIFSYVIDIINKQYAYLYENIDDNDNKDAINNLPRVIKWCVDKDYIQQAITLCSEKIPEYLFKTGLINMSKTTRKFIRDKSSENSPYEYYYNVLISYLKELPFNRIRGIAYYEVICEDVKNEFKNLDVISKLKVDDNIKEIKGKWGEYENGIYVKICENMEKLKNNAPKLFNVIKDILQDVNVGKCSTRYKKYLDIAGFDYSKKAKNYTLSELVQKCIKDKKTNLEAEKGMYAKLAYTCLANKNFIEAILCDNIKNIDMDKKVWFNKLFGNNRQKQTNFAKYIYKEILPKIYCQYFEDKEIYYTGKNVEDVFLIYGILKEQRNMTNHANIKQKDVYKALNINELSCLISYFVGFLEEDSNVILK